EARRRVRGDDAAREVPVEVRGREVTATIGHFALFLALCASAWAALASWLSTVASGRGLQKSAERGIYASFGAIAIAVLSLEIALVTDDFRLDAVFHYSSAAQALPY